MAESNELRSEATRLRRLATTQADPEVLAEIHEMIKELERKAREQDARATS